MTIFHIATVPVSVQVGIAQITLNAKIQFWQATNEPGGFGIALNELRDADGLHWPVEGRFARWIEANINRDELRASIDPAFAEKRAAALDAYLAMGEPRVPTLDDVKRMFADQGGVS